MREVHSEPNQEWHADMTNEPMKPTSDQAQSGAKRRLSED